MSNLPKRQLTPYDGKDLTQFRSFMMLFERMIESSCDGEGDKFTYLDQYTAGEPKKLFQSCRHFPPNYAFMKAKNLLITEYGNEHLVANAYLSKI